jgi:8-amino-7-oxononanoate synthase
MKQNELNAVTLVELLVMRAMKTPDRLAYRFLPDGVDGAESSFTYGELASRAASIAAGLRANGVEKGDRVIIFSPTGLEFVAAFFGILHAGAVAVPMCPPRFSRALLQPEEILRDMQARMAIVPELLIPRLAQARAKSAEFARLTICTFDQLETSGENASLIESAGPNLTGGNLALLQYSSGSTSAPKGVQITHDNLLFNAALIEQMMGLTVRSSVVNWLPLYHDMGLMAGVVQPLYTGYPVTLLSPAAFLARPSTWLQAITQYGATGSGGPNFAYELCVVKIGEEQLAEFDLGTWDVAFCGAEPIRADTLKRFATRFRQCGFRSRSLLPCYGLAEATLMVACGAKQDQLPVLRVSRQMLEQEHRAVSCSDGEPYFELVASGRPAPAQQVALVDPHSAKRCPDGQVGEIWIRGRSVSCGYWNRPDDNAHTFNARLTDSNEGPFLRTGDLGFLRDDQLFITGRLKDLIIIRGANHYPQDIELTVEHCHPALRPHAGAAFTIDDDGQEQLVLVHELERSWRAEQAPILDAIARDIASVHGIRPAVVVLVKHGTIPMTSSGKIQRAATKAAFLAGQLHIIAQWQNSEHSIARLKTEAGQEDVAQAAWLVRETIGKVLNLPAAQIDMNRSLAEVGLDSLSAAEVGLALEQKFGSKTRAWIQNTENWNRSVAQLAEELALAAFDVSMDSLIAAGAAEKTQATGNIVQLMPKIETFSRPVQEIVQASLAAAIAASECKCFVVTDQPAYRQIQQLLDSLPGLGVGNPYFRPRENVGTNKTLIGGSDYIHYSGYNYLGLSGHPAVTQAAKAAIDLYGTSVSASRVVSGEIPLHSELERELATMLRVDDCLVFNSGYGTNVSTIGYLCGSNDLLIHDALIHNSMLTGCILSGGQRLSFPHNDSQALDRLLALHRHNYDRAIVLVEGVYSMDGDIANLPKIIEVKRRHNCMLMVDEAHSLGILGESGFGIGEHFGINRSDVDIWMGTLSKSLASCGGYIGGSAELIKYLKYTAPGFVYSAGLSPPDTAAALAAVKILQAEPERAAAVRERAALFVRLAKKRGLNTGTAQGSAVVPVILGDSMKALLLADALFKDGINVHAIMHPAVEHAAARLRFFFTSLHTEAEVRQTVEALASNLQRINRVAAELQAACPA